ncbi:hypothetical protein IHE49_07455 [Rhodanobacter sp. 7MK24]|uniref:hypothetical protein n=1 Tax=Rhodanobacter sp. 7MK24 TaxID=2775922 RepID=UPI00177F3DC7|nr:hypothetical protein [Rhodanobacter sp. 7MK24]MBD8880313.1 hypothetical protein [Rhodanobacter sp. 7MK24]
MLAHSAVRAGLVAALLVCSSAAAQSFDPSALKLLQAMGREPTTLARYQYLIHEEPSLRSSDQVLALQFMSFSQDELGLYDQAVFSFPLKDDLPEDLKLPTSADWKSADAVDTIVALAAQRHLVMVNEAHHDAHTRQLTLELLPRLRALGFTYFAAEALGTDDPDLAKRGYPTRKSGTEYLRDPLYGDIVREAIRLGFTLVPYDNGLNGQARENAQAQTLYQTVFAKDPKARLFVHAGYAHIDKATGRLGDLQPMALRLQALTGQVPLSIDQTDFLETGLDTSDAYHQLEHTFPSEKPEVLLNRQTGQPWSARPTAYDVNVILPPSLTLDAFGKYKYGYRINGEGAPLPQVMDHNEMQRASWLSLDGKRRPHSIGAELCRGTIPCLVSAHYFGEPNDAIAADRYAIMGFNESTELYLRPGRYRLRASDSDGHTLSESSIDIASQ